MSLKIAALVGNTGDTYLEQGNWDETFANTGRIGEIHALYFQISSGVSILNPQGVDIEQKVNTYSNLHL